VSKKGKNNRSFTQKKKKKRGGRRIFFSPMNPSGNGDGKVKVVEPKAVLKKSRQNTIPAKQKTPCGKWEETPRSGKRVSKQRGLVGGIKVDGGDYLIQ